MTKEQRIKLLKTLSYEFLSKNEIRISSILVFYASVIAMNKEDEFFAQLDKLSFEYFPFNEKEKAIALEIQRIHLEEMKQKSNVYTE